jgi:cell division protein FtsI (penicillin-binding protein 3)
MMEGVTDEGGTGTKAFVDGFTVAGKTGTAQKVDPLTRRYSATKRTASFVGFVPVEQPKLAILVVIDEPKTSTYGGVVAAPAFSEIARQSLCYLKVPPLKPLKARAQVPGTLPAAKKVQETVEAEEGSFDLGNEGYAMPDFRGKSMREVLRIMGKSDLNVKLIGSGRAVEQNPRPGEKIRASDQVWVKFAPSA